MQFSTIDELATPHGHNASNARREGRKQFRVRVREGHSGQVLTDGRMYGPGEHVIQIYKSDEVNLRALFETDEALVAQAHARHAKKEALYYADEGMRPGTYNGSPQAEFQELALRGMLPLTLCEEIGELEPIATEARRRDEEMRRDVNREGAAVAGLTAADVQALVAEGVKAVVGDVVAKALSAERERVAATTAKAGK